MFGIVEGMAGLTVAEYHKKYHPGVFMFIDNELETFTDFHRFLDETERNFGLCPTFREDGTRVYHPGFIGWAVWQRELDKRLVEAGGVPGVIDDDEKASVLSEDSDSPQFCAEGDGGHVAHHTG